MFFTNGGRELVEAAWKIVRQHYLAKGEPQRVKAIAREIAYHGVTLGRAVVHRRAADEGAVRRVTDPGRADREHRIATRRGRTKAVLRAPARRGRAHDHRGRTGDGGDADRRAGPERRRVPRSAEGYWPGLRALCDKYGIALVADEVITGFGRIGEWFASSRYDVAPDLITCAKGITSAYAPMGAVIVCDRIAEPLYEDGRMLMHGITFAGHPVAAAIAHRNIEIFEREGVLENVREQEPYMGELLEGIKSRVPMVGDVRGGGVLLGAGARARREGLAVLRRGAREAAAGVPRRPAARGRPDRPSRRPWRRRAAPRPAAGRQPRGARGDGAKTEAVLADASERFFEGCSTPPTATGSRRRGRSSARALEGDVTADVVVIGGGYTGLWTAWQLRARGEVHGGARGGGVRAWPERAQRRVCETLWTHMPSLIERYGRANAIELWGVAESVADRRLVREQGVDAWFTRGLPDGLDRAGPRRGAGLDPRLARATVALALDGAALRARCDSPRFRRGLFVPDDATVQPARLALGLRRLPRSSTSTRGWSRCASGRNEVVAETAGGRVRAGAAVLAMNAATRASSRCATGCRSPPRTSS